MDDVRPPVAVFVHGGGGGGGGGPPKLAAEFAASRHPSY